MYIGNDDAVKLILQASMAMEQKVGDMMASIDDLRAVNGEMASALAELRTSVADAAARVDAKIQAFIDAQVQDSDVAAAQDNVAAVDAIAAEVGAIGADEAPPVEEPPVEEPPVEEPPVEEPPVEEPPVVEPPVEPPVEEGPPA